MSGGQSLAGRRILVTGAASGIGLATARRMRAEGAQLALLDRDEPAITALAAELGGFAARADLRNEAEIVAAVRAAAAVLGGIDGLANVAGIGGMAPVEEMTLADWQAVIDVNLTAPFLLTRECVPLIRAAGGGTIVNVASGQGLMPSVPRMGSYGASKGGLVAFTRAMALELAPLIRVNSVCPGVILTPLVPDTMIDAAKLPGSPYAMKRIGEPDEVAAAIVFLSSSESSFITGTAMAIDGGRTYH